LARPPTIVAPEVLVPTLLVVGPYRFFIFMGDCAERRHVHVNGGGGGEAKIWLEPVVGLAATRGYTRTEMSGVVEIVADHRLTLVARWDAACGGSR
jgi:hypothetical protein